MGNQVRNTAGQGRHRGHAAGHGFQGSQSERLGFTWVMEGMHTGYEPFHVVLLTQKLHVIVQTQLPGQMPGRTPLRSVAGHDQLCVPYVSYFGEDPYAVEHALDGTEIRNMQDTLPSFGARLLIRPVERAVHEIVNNLNGIPYAEKLNSPLAHVFADGCNSVRPLN